MLGWRLEGLPLICDSCSREVDSTAPFPLWVRRFILIAFAALHLGAVVGQSTLGALCRNCRLRTWFFLLPMACGILTTALVAGYLMIQKIPLFFRL